ncbi:metal-sensing transcriptional repressor [bacterium]|nr:metal-sensing transcriptional repressor [bacterium]
MAKGSTAKKSIAPSGLKMIRGMEYLSPESQKNLADRLARIEGHLRAVRNMVLQHRCADEVLLQIAAVKAAINKVAGVIVDQEMKACVKFCMEGNSDERLERTLKVLSTILKQT